MVDGNKTGPLEINFKDQPTLEDHYRDPLEEKGNLEGHIEGAHMDEDCVRDLVEEYRDEWLEEDDERLEQRLKDFKDSLLEENIKGPLELLGY